MIDSITSSAIQGFQRAQQGMARNASEIARAKTANNQQPEVDMARSLVEMKQHKLYGQAAAKVLETANEMVGTLLDVEA